MPSTEFAGGARLRVPGFLLRERSKVAVIGLMRFNWRMVPERVAGSGQVGTREAR